MILTPDQLHTILEILDRQMIMFIGESMGPTMLSEEEKRKLTSYGIDYNAIYSEAKDPVVLNYHLGMISNVMGAQKAQGMTYEQLKHYMASGQHIALNAREQATINNIKAASLADIRSAKGRIFADINQVVAQQFGNVRADQEEFLREELIRGTERREDVKKIAIQLAKKTGDWSRDFRKSVQYVSHTALNEGRAAMIERRAGGDNKQAKVYFHVQGGACEHCIRLYLTGGLGSEPKIFTLKELQLNGNNIGRKVRDWKPTLAPIHVHCRCLATEYVEGEKWDGEKFTFPKDEPYVPKIDRPKVSVTINGKEIMV
jgi:hypothetical protein